MQGLDVRLCLSETYNNTIMATFLRLRRITGFTVVLLKAVHSFKGGGGFPQCLNQLSQLLGHIGTV